MFILDSNILTDFFKGHGSIQSRVASAYDVEGVATTVISWFEILSGRIRSVLKAAHRRELLIGAQRFIKDQQGLEEFTILPITHPVADHFGRLLANKKLKKTGRPDLLIACIALANSATLVTRNTKDFEMIPSLKLQNWAD
jgi:tRNA(fMet)-specific endonuclease VapC